MCVCVCVWVFSFVFLILSTTSIHPSLCVLCVLYFSDYLSFLKLCYFVVCECVYLDSVICVFFSLRFSHFFSFLCTFLLWVFPLAMSWFGAFISENIVCAVNKLPTLRFNAYTSVQCFGRITFFFTTHTHKHSNTRKKEYMFSRTKIARKNETQWNREKRTEAKHTMNDMKSERKRRWTWNVGRK